MKSKKTDFRHVIQKLMLFRRKIFFFKIPDDFGKKNTLNKKQHFENKNIKRIGGFLNRKYTIN